MEKQQKRKHFNQFELFETWDYIILKGRVSVSLGLRYYLLQNFSPAWAPSLTLLAQGAGGDQNGYGLNWGINNLSRDGKLYILIDK